MGLKVRLDWYNRDTEIAEGKEYSADLGDDFSIIQTLGLLDEKEIYDGGFDVSAGWVVPLQCLFKHRIDISTHDYQVAFRYRKPW